MTEPEAPKQDAAPTTQDLAEERTRLAGLRSHLANERTFLAWQRTAFTLMAFGFLLEKMDLLWGAKEKHTDLGYLGLAAFAMGGVLAVWAARRYTILRREIGGRGPVDTRMPDLLAMVTVGIIFLFGLLFLIHSVFAG